MANPQDYTPGATTKVTALAKAPKGGKLGDLLKKYPQLEGLGYMLFTQFLMGQGAGLYDDLKTAGIQQRGLQAQTEMTTPENLYYQAALPGAQEEERMARQALMQHLTGGVIGPSLAKGERMIGGP